MRRRTGFTLIEVILAVSILGVALVTLLTALTRCLAVVKRGYRYEEVQWALSMGEVEYPLTVTDEIEDLEVDEVEYEGGMIFSREVDDDEDEDDLYVVRTKISWTDKGRELNEELVRYVLQFESE